jgi:hypothetical protein
MNHRRSITVGLAVAGLLALGACGDPDDPAQPVQPLSAAPAVNQSLIDAHREFQQAFEAEQVRPVTPTRVQALSDAKDHVGYRRVPVVHPSPWWADPGRNRANQDPPRSSAPRWTTVKR